MKKSLFLLLIVGIVTSSHAQDVRVLNNGKASITVERRLVQDQAAFVIREITGEDGRADFSQSPLWQIDLRQLYPQNGGLMKQLPTFVVPDLASLSKGVLELDSSQVIWGTSNNTLLTLIWKNIPLSTDTLTVKVYIELPSGSGGPLFNLESELSGSDSLAIHSMRFPLLVLEPFGDPADDRLILPFSGGRYLDNPTTRTHNWPDSTGDLQATTWDYPGNMQHQFLYYYDLPSELGIYLGCHDPKGNVKRLFYTTDESKERLILYLRHFNGANPDEDIRTAFRYFSLVDEYDYTCQVAILKGDWQHAADYYRQSMIEQPFVFEPDSGFLRRGTLLDRQDMTRQVKENDVNIQYRTTPYPEALDLSENPHDGKISDFERVVDLVEFLYRDVPQAKVFISPRNYLGGGMENIVPTDDRGLVGGSTPTNLPQLLSMWRNRLGGNNVLFGFNQDTGNWLSEDYQTELPRSIVKLENLKPLPRPWRTIMGTITCEGSQYILSRRYDYSNQVLTQSDYGELPGFEMILWSGQGSLPKCCYAPADPTTQKENHNHRIGGGNYWAMEWRRSMKDMYQQHKSFRPNMFIAAERGHEQMIDVSLLGGHIGIYPYQDNSGSGEILMAQPIPLLSYMWHDYMPMVPGSFDSETASSISRRLEMVQNFVAGRRFSFELDARNTNNYGAPEELFPEWLLNLKYLRCLVTARTLFPQILVYGKFLHFPEVETEKEFLPFVEGGRTEYVPIPKVWGGALQVPQNWNNTPAGDAGAIGLVFSNFTTEPTQMSFKVDFPLPTFSRAVWIDTSGVHEYSGTISPSQPIILPPLSSLVAVFGGATTNMTDPDSKIKFDFALKQNYPNPFNPSTTIRFSLPKAEHITLKVFDVLGREIETLVEEELNFGEYSVVFDTKNLPSGVYFYRLTTPTFSQTKSMEVLK